MNSISIPRVFLIISLIFLINIPANINLIFGETPYVLVTLKDNTTEKFEYDSFELNWIQSQIKDEFTCDAYDIDKEKVTEIYVLSLMENPCIEGEYKEDRSFDVYFSNRNAIQGFIELFEPNVTGKLLDKGEIKTIPYSDIKKISFFR
jgi:hypothetical protein